MEKWKDYKLEALISINVFVEDDLALESRKLIQLANESRYMVDKSMAYLVETGYVEVAMKRPKAYKVCHGSLEHILSL